MTLMIIIIIIITIIIITTTTTTMIINSRFVPYVEQKNSRTFQGLHISHFSRIPFNAKKSLEYVSFLVLPQ